jgi:hypothetical protein
MFNNTEEVFTICKNWLESNQRFLQKFSNKNQKKIEKKSERNRKNE